MISLPVDHLQSAYHSARQAAKAVVLTSPTGSGKSTRVPLWSREYGPVLVIEPRRVAARSLARRVCSETRTPPGEQIGWAVRDDACWNRNTEILFVTPGVALKMLASGEMDRFATWILDEFHERRAETDLLLAIARQRNALHRVVILSATLQASTLAQTLDATLLESDGAHFPVTMEYRPDPQQTQPTEARLPLRIEKALLQLEILEGCVLVFLPGVGEIRETRAWLDRHAQWEILELHGTLSSEEQDRVFAPLCDRVRVVLCTNVAESALTVPDVVAVIDSGLERRIEREQGFTCLRLETISQASADQRAGRAGRTRRGRCVRLWSATARLVPRAPLAIALENPDAWMLACLSAGHAPETLPWLDRPRADALREVRQVFGTLGVWSQDPWNPWDLGQLTPKGQRVLSLALPVRLAAFVLELSETSAARDAIALASALATQRPLLRARPREEQLFVRQHLAGEAGDVGLLARVLECDWDTAQQAGVNRQAWEDACATAQRVWGQLGIENRGWPSTFQTDSVLRAWVCAFPRSLRLRRGAAGREEYALGQGTPMRLDSASLAGREGPPPLVLVFSAHGGQDKDGKPRQWADVAVALTGEQVLRLGLGQTELRSARLEQGRVIPTVRARVGDFPLGELAFAEPSPALWAKAVVELLEPAILAQNRTALEQYWRSVCVRRGEWVPPPSDAKGWLCEQLEAQGDAPFWPTELPRPPLPLLTTSEDTVFPEFLAMPQQGGQLRVQVDALEGKITLIPENSQQRPNPKKLNLPTSWRNWKVSIGKVRV